ncbi:MAG TPA: GNAT family N-acyltransferase [Casimicrobiaceae bacterium]
MNRLHAFAPERNAAQGLVISIAQSREDVRCAQQLRHRVFVEEMGARLGAQGNGVERDGFDPFCEHLIVREGRSGEVIGTYRLLTPERAQRAGTFIAEREFALEALAPLRPHLAELGRACIDRRYRNGATIMLLWSGIARYVKARGIRYLFGCASIASDDGGLNASAVYARLIADHLAPAEYRVVPRKPFALCDVPANTLSRVPALLKGYLRAGAWICGAPAWDPEFETVDLLVLLPLARVEARYARHFLGEAVTGARSY